MNKYSFITRELASRKDENRMRFLRTVTPGSGAESRVEGKNLINFSSNDYLGLSKHPLVIDRSVEFTKRYGAGSTASRMICGSIECFERTERKLADLKGTESALIMNSGFQANASIIPAFADRKTLILSDRLNHSSIIQGALLSRCRVVKYDHNDLSHLRSLLETNYMQGYSRILIVTESVFSVDGDASDIDRLAEISEEFGALLIVDEAHATGVMGKKGMGLTCGKSVDLTIGTFGKACGSFGAYAACSELIKDYLINCCAGFIYTTAMPPSVIGSIDAALELIPGMESERTDIAAKAGHLRLSLNSLGWSTGLSTTHIVPVIIGDDKDALSVSKYLEIKGILAAALRPPTVENGESRIRLAVSALHTQKQVEFCITAFEKLGGLISDDISHKNICHGD